jgi:hypothetical protein
VGSPDANWEYFVADINPSEVFEKVRFDPRLAPFEREERKKLAQSLGYAGPFCDNGLYQTVLLQACLSKHWDEY